MRHSSLYWPLTSESGSPCAFSAFPVSVPLLRTVIAALVDGRLVEGFEARNNPLNLARGDALSADPARRAAGAGDLSRRVEDRRRDPAAHRRARRHRRGRTRLRRRGRTIRRPAPLDIPPQLGELERRLTLARLVAAWAKGPVSGAAGGRRPGLDAGAGRRSGAADGRHGDARRRLGRARRAGAGSARPILAALAAISCRSPARSGRII